MFLNFSQFPQAHPKQYDICIIGSGAAGLAVAHSVWDSNNTVCIVESGAGKPGPRYQELNRAESVGLKYDCVESRCRGFGGTLNMWGGTCASLDPIDFRKRPWLPISGWPITQDTLKPYYHQATEFLRAPSGMSALARLPDDCVAQLMPLNVPEKEFDRKPFLLLHAHTASLIRRLRSVVSTAKNVDCVTDATAVEIVQRNSGAVDHIALRSLHNGGTKIVRARAFVICAGGLETPRLLLASRGTCRDGIGNGRGLVGRYFMDHARLRSSSFALSRVMRIPVLTQMRASTYAIRTGFTIKEELQERLELCNHSFFLNPVSVDVEDKAIRVVESIPRRDSDASKSGSARVALIQKLRRVWRAIPPQGRLALENVLSNRTFGRLMVVTKMEQIPAPDSRIALSQEKDQFDMPRIRLDWRIDEFDRRGIANFHNLIRGAFERCGHQTANLDFKGPGGDYTFQDTSHPMGTTRMAHDEQWGVVDPDLRVFGVANLFICSSSVFPSGGNANPTLTILALAKRLGSHIAHQLADRKL